jgi:hypothetical protein
MPSKPNFSKLRSDLNRLKAAANELERRGRRLQQANNNLQSAVRRAQARPAPTYSRRPVSFTPTSSEYALVDSVRQHVVADQVERPHDIFLSHATPDLAVARDLSQAMMELGAEVWLDDFSIRLGVNIVRAIDRGIALSHVGVVLVTPAVIAGRVWVEREFSALLNSKEQVIPVLHGVTWSELAAYSPLLHLNKGLSTEDRSISEIAELIVSTLE